MIAIISDIHGNYPALKATLGEIDKLGCEQIISLGDVAGYYCMINECVDELRKWGVTALMGNHDDYLVSGNGCPRSTTANLCLDYQRGVISEENLQWIKKSLPYIDSDVFSLRHGGWNNLLDEYISDFDFSISKMYHAKMFFTGHTHIPKLLCEGNVSYCNPGSVGQPRDGDHRASFALLDNSKIEIKRVEYDIDAIADEMRRNGFDKRVYECLYKGTKIGG